MSGRREKTRHRCLRLCDVHNVPLSARTSGDVPRPWTSLGRPRTTPDVPARPGTSAWDVPARPGTVKTINKYLELVEHLYDEAVKKQNDEAKTVLRKQNYSTKNPATGQLNNIRDTGGAQPLAANGGKYPEKKTLKPYRELTDGEKEKIRAFQKKATFPITDNADMSTFSIRPFLFGLHSFEWLMLQSTIPHALLPSLLRGLLGLPLFLTSAFYFHSSNKPFYLKHSLHLKVFYLQHSD